MHPHKRIIPFLLLAITVTASVAHAAGRFTSATATVTDGNVRQMSVDVLTFHGGLLVSFHEVGVSANEAATYNVTADCIATYACINRGGNNPKAANKTIASTLPIVTSKWRRDVPAGKPRL